MDSKNVNKENKNKKSGHLTLVKGEKLISPKYAGGEFIMAEATNTRLMGVVGLHLKRKSPEGSFHQFFYLDAEEYGLSDYHKILTDDEMQIERKKNELFGGLGGDWVSLTEKEAAYLLQSFVRMNFEFQLPLPEDSDEFSAMALAKLDWSPEENEALWDKICVEPLNDYEVINYFVMRGIACDYTGQRRLISPECLEDDRKRPFDFPRFSEPSTLYGNDISLLSSPEDGVKIYSCEFLSDERRNFQKIVATIGIKDRKVISYRTNARLNISTWEAAIILRRPEYIIHCKCDIDPEFFREMMFSLFTTVTDNPHDIGTLYMIFNKNNDHTRKEHYRLEQDTRGIVTLLDSGELMIVGNEPTELTTIEMLITAGLALTSAKITEKGNYKFPDPVFGVFLDSDFYAFSDFLDYLETIN